MQGILKIRLSFLVILVLLITQNTFSQAYKSMKESEDRYSKKKNINKLSTNQIDGYEKRATQKVVDFADYLSIVANKEYDQKLRKQAITMIQKMFVEDKINISKTDKTISTSKVMNLSPFLDAYYQHNFDKVTLVNSEVALKNSVRMNNEGEYTGKITFIQKSDYYKNGKIITSTSVPKTIDIYLIKTKKKFGNNKEIVWNVFLGSVK